LASVIHFKLNIFLELILGNEEFKPLDYLVEEVKEKSEFAEKPLIFCTTPLPANKICMEYMHRLGPLRRRTSDEGEDMHAAIFNGATGPVTIQERLLAFI